MNDALRMQISAFVDGELPDNESELLLRRLSQDPDLRQLVAEYLDIGRALRNETELPDMGQLRGRIAESLGEEVPATGTVGHVAERRYVKPLAGFAIAASVALVAIFSLQQVGGPVAEEISPPQVAGSDQVLDDMFRYHGNSAGGATAGGMLTELVEYDINEEGLVRVEPKGQLLAPARLETDVDEDEDEEIAADDDATDVPAEQ